VTKKIDSAVAVSVTEAVRSVEDCSCAEMVVEVRDRSGSYAHADSRFGALFAFVTLVAVLFARWVFAPEWVAVDAAIAYGLGLLISRSSHFIRRSMTTRRDRERKVHTAAAATFVDRGIAKTRRSTGMLVYLSLLERRIELIADRGILDAVPSLEWNQLVEAIRGRRATQSTLVDVLHALQPLLLRYAPNQSGDRDELPNDVIFVTE
jgi:putative membrane protein